MWHQGPIHQPELILFANAFGFTTEWNKSKMYSTLTWLKKKNPGLSQYLKKNVQSVQACVVSSENTFSNITNDSMLSLFFLLLLFYESFYSIPFPLILSVHPPLPLPAAPPSCSVPQGSCLKKTVREEQMGGGTERLQENWWVIEGGKQWGRSHMPSVRHMASQWETDPSLELL